MIAPKQLRLKEMFRRLQRAHPFATWDEARLALETVMRDVEDEFTTIPEDPDAANAKVSDGRMYPPTDKYERPQPCASVRLFRHIAHKTFFGRNGALRISRLNGEVDLDLPGADGLTIDHLWTEQQDEERN